jgi:hypothetical protein
MGKLPRGQQGHIGDSIKLFDMLIRAEIEYELHDLNLQPYSPSRLDRAGTLSSQLEGRTSFTAQPSGLYQDHLLRLR